MKNKKRISVTILPFLHEKAVKLSKKEFGKENFSRYVEHLILKQDD